MDQPTITGKNLMKLVPEDVTLFREVELPEGLDLWSFERTWDKTLKKNVTKV